MRILQIIHDSLVASDRLKATKFLAEIGQSDGVMEDPVGSVVIGVRTANDAYYWKVLAVGTGYGVEYAQAADGEGDNAGPDSAAPGVAVSRVAGVEFVAAAYEIEARFSQEVVEECEVNLARNGEDVIDTDLD